MRNLGMLFENWQREIARPVLTSLVTAFLLFLGSLAFKPVRSFLFPPKTDTGYPLVCTAEPYLDSSGQHLMVDFFVVNRIRHEYTHEELAHYLSTERADLGPDVSPDIHLKLKMAGGKPYTLEKIDAPGEDPFNLGKGDLQVERPDRSIVIRVLRISENAVMKVTMTFALADINPASVRRTVKVKLPFDIADYEDACYTRP